MTRDGAIVYVGTQSNPKSALGRRRASRRLEREARGRFRRASRPDAHDGAGSRPPGIGEAAPEVAPQVRHLARAVHGGGRHPPRDRVPDHLGRDATKRASGAPERRTTSHSLERLVAQIGEEILSLARLVALNCHSSFLPGYRGANVTYAPLINREKESGVTLHEMTSRLDAGRILAQARVSIDPRETPESLSLKRARLSGRVIVAGLEVAGHPERYLPNPPSPLYFRCGRPTYRRFVRRNRYRKLFGLPPIKYEPGRRYDG